MATYVLVPGGWSGGWQWRTVANHLRRLGHEVFTATLTGLGERVHLGTPDTDLETHIRDIINVIQFENLNNVLLVGYSYSGMVITGVADRIPERIAHLIYLDAVVPQDGQSLGDILGAPVMAMLSQIAQQVGDGWRVPHNPPDVPYPVTDHPLKTALQAVQARNPDALTLPRTFIYCTEDKDPNDPVMAAIARCGAMVTSDPRWHYYELPTGHLPWDTMPEALADILHTIAR